MNVWAISDLHLSFARPDRRDRYAGRWRDHASKVEQSWREIVRAEDLVLLPGDLSMARNHRDLQPDFDWLHRMPGTKVLSPGNHDQWWNGVDAIIPLLRPSMLAVDGTAIEIAGTVVCGTLGATVPTEEPTSRQHDDTKLALHRLAYALAQAEGLRSSPETPLFVLWHFPPFDGHGRPGPWVELMEQARVTHCLYGHLHTTAQWARAVQGRVGTIRYACVAADAIGFRPLRIRTPLGGGNAIGRTR